MQVEFNQEKASQLIRDGYCKFDQVLTDEMLAELHRSCEALLVRQTEEEASRQKSTGSMISVFEHPFFAKLVTYPAAIQALHSLGYEDVKFNSGFVISKPPNGPRLFWHQDYIAWDDADCLRPKPQQLFAMYYLQDTSRENGCLRVIPGSHLHENPLHYELKEAHSRELTEAKNMDNPAFSDRPDEVDVPVKAGDLLLGDARLLHAAHENKTNQRRTLITLWYFDMKDTSEPYQATVAQRAGKPAENWTDRDVALLAPYIAKYNGDALPLKHNRHRPLGGK